MITNAVLERSSNHEECQKNSGSNDQNTANTQLYENLDTYNQHHNSSHPYVNINEFHHQNHNSQDMFHPHHHDHHDHHLYENLGNSEHNNCFFNRENSNGEHHFGNGTGWSGSSFGSDSIDINTHIQSITCNNGDQNWTNVNENNDKGTETGSSSHDAKHTDCGTGSCSHDTGSSSHDTGSSSHDTGSSSHDTGSSAYDTGSSACDTGYSGCDTSSSYCDTGNTGSDWS